MFTSSDVGKTVSIASSHIFLSTRYHPSLPGSFYEFPNRVQLEEQDKIGPYESPLADELEALELAKNVKEDAERKEKEREEAERIRKEEREKRKKAILE